jgi:hypothetical protein
MGLPIGGAEVSVNRGFVYPPPSPYFLLAHLYICICVYSVIYTMSYIITYTRLYTYTLIYPPVSNSYYGHTCDMSIFYYTLCLYTRVYTGIYIFMGYLNSVN